MPFHNEIKEDKEPTLLFITTFHKHLELEEKMTKRVQTVKQDKRISSTFLADDRYNVQKAEV